MVKYHVSEWKRIREHSFIIIYLHSIYYAGEVGWLVVSFQSMHRVRREWAHGNKEQIPLDP